MAEYQGTVIAKVDTTFGVKRQPGEIAPGFGIDCCGPRRPEAVVSENKTIPSEDNHIHNDDRLPVKWKLSTQASQTYQMAEGYPHIVIDNFLDTAAAEDALEQFPTIDNAEWINYLHYNEKKYGLTKLDALPPAARAIIDELNGKEFLDFLSDLTGIPGLIGDPSLEGGGLHQIPPGGFLNIHADFTAHPHHRRWRRRVNVLIYLNKDWEETYGGHLELWTPDMKRMFHKVLPVFNRCIIFNTDPDAFHGHPDPLSCPPGMSRKSIALYYFTEETSDPLKRATNYQARPGEGAVKSLLIVLDKKMLSLYNWIKGLLGINDDTASAILGWISRRRQ